jgi:hypothetical protein
MGREPLVAPPASCQSDRRTNAQQPYRGEIRGKDLAAGRRVEAVMPRFRLSSLIRSAWFLSLAAGTVLIAAGSLIYFDAEELAPFVIEKLPLPLEGVWLFALKTHVIAAAFALPACLLLSLKVMFRVPRLHRWLGRVTGVVVLSALAPSGFYLSLFAKGGLPATLGFALSGVVVVAAMIKGVLTARAKDYVAHRRFALHVLAQLSVAVTSRALLFVFDAFGVDPDGAYLFSLWAPVLGSLFAVELLVSRRPSRRKHHEAHSHPVVVAHRQSGLGHAI